MTVGEHASHTPWTKGYYLDGLRQTTNRAKQYKCNNIGSTSRTMRAHSEPCLPEHEQAICDKPRVTQIPP